MTQTERSNYLNYLSTGFYVIGGFSCICSFFPVIHLVMGIGMLTGIIPVPEDAEPGAEAITKFVGLLFMMFSLFIIIMGLAFGIAQIVAGHYMRLRKNHQLIFILSIIACLNIPFGMIIGIFSIILLVQEETKEMFDVQES